MIGRPGDREDEERLQVQGSSAVELQKSQRAPMRWNNGSRSGVILMDSDPGVLAWPPPPELS